MSKPTISKNELTELETKLLFNLQYGSENAIQLKILQEKLGVREPRKIRLAVESLRQNLWAVLSNEDGYFLCKTRQERNKFSLYHCKEIRSRVKMLKVTMKACNERLGKCFQLPMI